jgi:hypothetical protein
LIESRDVFLENLDQITHMENIRLLEDEEFTQENSGQITPIKDEEHAQPDFKESSFEDKTLKIPKIMGVKEDWISIVIIMKKVGELKDKDDLQLYLKIIMY